MPKPDTKLLTSLNKHGTLEFLGELGHSLMNALYCLWRRFPMPSHIMAQLFAVDAGDFLQASKGEGVAVISQEAGRVVGELELKSREFLP